MFEQVRSSDVTAVDAVLGQEVCEQSLLVNSREVVAGAKVEKIGRTMIKQVV